MDLKIKIIPLESRDYAICFFKLKFIKIDFNAKTKNDKKIFKKNQEK